MRACLRPVLLVSAALTLAGCSFWEGSDKAQTPRSSMPAAGSFETFVESLWPDARSRGVSRTTFDRAFAGVNADESVVALTRKQSEFVRPIWAYVNDAVTEDRLRRGRAAAAEWGGTLDRIERIYGVPRGIVLGVWGMETSFGSFTGGKDVIRSLATLAHTRYRGEFFRGELLTALQILQRGDVTRDAMKGSWAGAMGQTQFMPSSYMKYAIDGSGDGRADIWTNVPDALASTANYLKQHGWKPGLPWGMEVVIPERFDYRQRRNSFERWAAAGLRRADGAPMPGRGEANLFFPAGADGPAFLLTDNFAVIKAYNASDAYGLGVAHLGDRIMGEPPLRGQWPTDKPQLSKDETQEAQNILARLGYEIGEPDGRVGSKTREAVRSFQERKGLKADGYPTHAVLKQLRTSAR